MAATVTVTKKFGIGGTASLVVGTIAWDSTYPSGGEVLSIPDIERAELVIAQGSGYVGEWDQNDQKLKLYYGDYSNASDGVLVENATADISAVTAMPFVAIGS